MALSFLTSQPRCALEIPLQFDETRTSRPYKWAQHLAGIDFLPEVSPLLTASETPGDETSKHAAVISDLSLYRQQNRDLTGIDMDGQSGTLKEEVENAGEDGELLSLIPVAAVVNDIKLDPSKGSLLELIWMEDLGSLLEHSIGLALISKSIVSPINNAKSLSFRKHDEDSYLMLDSESDWEEPLQIEPGDGKCRLEFAAMRWLKGQGWSTVFRNSRVLARTMDNNERNMKLEAKIKISVEYTLRPPHFAVNLYTASVGDSSF
ncbi:hypothetical protein F0562_027663 [Nyssa sinensis]|uniref:Uncharacterized protein n=1 Tax=Nyssa sinensis TaxID=561372 RepID=A0A5J5B7L7_9ASTE|nr:hypothetical protein F0562_027663 [Nyssa sinensis]